MRIIVGKGTLPWVPEHRWFSALAEASPSGQTVEFRCRPMVDRYAYRGVNSNGRITIIVDVSETPESIKWLLLHEMAHSAVEYTPFAKQLRAEPKPPGYPHDDDAHESVTEEKLANAVADTLAPRFGTRPGLNRRWWRARCRAFGLCK